MKEITDDQALQIFRDYLGKFPVGTCVHGIDIPSVLDRIKKGENISDILTKGSYHNTGIDFITS